MPRRGPPKRLIHTTLMHGDRSASFIWAEGLGKGSFIALRRREGPLRDQKAVSGKTLYPSIMDWPAQCIDDPFNTKNAPLGRNVDVRLPWIEILLGSNQVVITGSPPTLTSFKSLAVRSRGVVIGAWIGYEAAHAVGAPFLTFVSVPMGMLVVSGAAGMARALETGLEQWLMDRMKPRTKRSRPKPKKRAIKAESGEFRFSVNGEQFNLSKSTRRKDAG